MIPILSILFGACVMMPITVYWVWPSLEALFDFIWIDPTKRAAKRMAKESKSLHVLPEMTDEGELAMMSASTGISGAEIKKALGAVSAQEALDIVRAVKTGKPTAVFKIMRIMGLSNKPRIRMPQDY